MTDATGGQREADHALVAVVIRSAQTNVTTTIYGFAGGNALSLAFTTLNVTSVGV
jgi:hypothetical protein